MSRSYTRDQLKISTGKILQTLGWNSVNSTPLEILTDILGNYMTQITRTTNSYANEFGCTEPNLDHLGLTFRDMGISVPELEEYVKYVNFGPPPTAAPKYPLNKEDHLNFLKPGSKEVVTRPVHIHEHLPPMNPLLEGNKADNETANCKVEESEENSSDSSQVFKKPADINPTEFKRPSFRREEEGSRPTREISSVMMTTSGFLSPAREGKLPESKTPISSVDPMGPANLPPEIVDLNKKPTKVFNKKIEKRKVKPGGLPDQLPPEEKKKRINNIKSVLKSKQQQQQIHQQQQMQQKMVQNKLINEVNIASIIANKMSQKAKVDKTLAAARLKTEKLNTTITPIMVKPTIPQLPLHEADNIDKLFSEPDKKKVNIFKKISNVKNEKTDVKVIKKEDIIKQESRESSPDLIIDEPDEIVSKITRLSNDVTIEPINHIVPHKSPEKMDTTSYFDDDSQPGTPSTPKTPELITHSPPVVKEKRKRKDSRKVKKIHRLDDVLDLELKRPKTPDAHLLTKLGGLDVFQNTMPMGLHPMGGPIGPMPFPFQFGGIPLRPGLIPTPLQSPLFPPSYFSQKPYNPIPPPVSQPPPLQPPNHFPQVEEVLSKPPLEKLPPPPELVDPELSPSSKLEKKSKEHKKDKKDKLKKRNKKDKIKNKAEKKKLREEKKDKIKKEKKEKRKEKETKDTDSSGVKITFKIKSPSPRPETPEPRKLNIKPVVKKEEEAVLSGDEDRVKRETSPGLAKISALVFGPPKPKSVAPPPPLPAEEVVKEEGPVAPAPRTGPGPGRPRIHPIKPKQPAAKPKKRRTPIKKDADGNEVWICPACGRQDDGSPMIGCDGCDAWYHWVCVGIQVPPDATEDWYCRHCLLKKNEDLQSDKQKKKRKKKEKKDY